MNYTAASGLVDARTNLAATSLWMFSWPKCGIYVTLWSRVLLEKLVKVVLALEGIDLLLRKFVLMDYVYCQNCNKGAREKEEGRKRVGTPG